MTVRLRGHHLLCILTYKGEGYSEAFTANFDRIVARLARGEDYEIVEGPDDICACLLGEKPDAHCLNESVSARDTLALEQARGEGLATRGVLTKAMLARLRNAFSQNRIRAACDGCEWHGLCTHVAADGFAGVSLKL